MADQVAQPTAAAAGATPAPEATPVEPAGLRVIIATGHRTVYDGSAEWLIAPCACGQVAIGAHHAPLVAVMEAGETIVRTGREALSFAIGGGYLEVRDGTALLLADSAQPAEEIDLTHAVADLAEAKQALAEAHGEVRSAEALARVRRANAWLVVAQHSAARRSGSRR